MNKIIALITCLIFTLFIKSATAQDTTEVKSKKLPPEIKIFGPYIVTMDNGKITAKKNPNYDASKALKRDTTTPWDNGIVEVYAADATMLENTVKLTPDYGNCDQLFP